MARKMRQPLAADMQRLIEDLRAAIQSAFESEDYRNRREALAQEFKEHQEGPTCESPGPARWGIQGRARIVDGSRGSCRGCCGSAR